jgi:hypothetical protein
MPMTHQAAIAYAFATMSVAAMSVLASVASAQQPVSPGFAGNPSVAAQPDGSWPTVLKPSLPSDPSAQEAPQWSAEWSDKEIADGRARCATLLKGLDVVAEPAPPIREGSACGAPAPMHLVSIGSSPKIAFSPPATLTCEMIAALHKWLVGDVQPLARKHLGAPVVEVATMSSFSCRNAYGRARTKLSEHGRVNAIDIGAFLTERGEKALVVADWGPIAREIASDAKAEAVKRQAEAAAAARKAKPPAEAPRVATPDTVKSFQAGTSIPIGIPRVTFGIRGPGGANDLTTGSSGLGWAPPSQLGGPKEAKAAPGPVPDPVDGKAGFLHAVHKAACTTFATVLGPEANRAHKNHFHLDMAERKSPSICE